TGSIKAKPGQRDALLAILKDAAANAPTMPGCLTYEVRAAIDDPDAIFVSEVWVDEASHAASLRLESVRAAIARARPLIA
ncbi:MAG TPA: putative quinol monooxygenase, partial [Planctomycetota bacterium]|nr:putative quinol monooxygenase [Planctomycetota bacterium]